MKRMQRCLLFCALLMVIGATIRPAMSYFTTYVTAKGGYVVHLQEDSEIHETAVGLEKTVVIENTDEKVPVYVRAKAIASSQYTPNVTPGDNWSEEIDGWYYYENILNPGDKTSEDNPLLITVTTPKVPVNEKESVNFDNINVVLVYESAPVIYKDGEALSFDSTEIWKQKVTTDKQKGEVNYED